MCSVIVSSTVNPTRSMRTRVCTTVSDPLYTLAGLSKVRSQSTPRTSMQPQSSQNVGLYAAAADFFPVMFSQQTATPIASYTSPLGEGQSSLQSQQFDAWTTITQAIKQGPSLPKVEMMKFSGDPLEYTEFKTNFTDNIKSQVSEKSQRVTCLLAQCTGRAKEAIRSCVNLPVGQRYTEACRTLQANFGQSHMIVEAHVRKLREIQVRKADTSSLMEFVRRLGDARRVLTSMGCTYMNCLRRV